MEYFLFNIKNMQQISRSLIVSHEIFSNHLYVSKFYPEIFRELDSRYMSATCFYLLIHHAAEVFHIGPSCCINLETDVSVFETFYMRLKDFDFKIFHPRPVQKAYVRGLYKKIVMDTDRIIHRLP